MIFLSSEQVGLIIKQKPFQGFFIITLMSSFSKGVPFDLLCSYFFAGFVGRLVKRKQDVKWMPY